MRRVAITGMGLVSPLGDSPVQFFNNLAAGISGIRRLQSDFSSQLASPIAATVAFDGASIFPANQYRMLDRVSQFGLAAANAAITDSRLDFADEPVERVGVFMGTGMGGAQTLEQGYRDLFVEQARSVKPFSVLMAMQNAAASWIALDHGLTGPNLTFSTACSSSAVAIGEAWKRIRLSEADIMIAGGAEAPLTLGVLKAWESLRTLATEDKTNPANSCKPFARDRSGLVLGEGAAVVVLEAWDHAVARGAFIHAELIGYGLSTDASHITRPSIGGQARAMKLAIDSAGIDADEIDYINAHGTGTAANDPVETAAIKQVFGGAAYEIPVSSSKSMHGHLLGAAGALELIATILAMQSGTAPPTMHLHEPDPECDLDYVPNVARENLDIASAMSNSFAFGGTNAVLITRRAL
ncbi:MAG TPA: beta-ketoacyl-[acyl-carrier-protein] synthase family protein [Methylophilaceae bacterium]|nr:beta-ketoacyl-[acyl-carrier-protein] synthase family protein [Methylophilaceae bacterium]